MFHMNSVNVQDYCHLVTVGREMYFFAIFGSMPLAFVYGYGVCVCVCASMCRMCD